jgi:uncharacterized membrane protein
MSETVAGLNLILATAAFVAAVVALRRASRAAGRVESVRDRLRRLDADFDDLDAEMDSLRRRKKQPESPEEEQAEAEPLPESAEEPAAPVVQPARPPVARPVARPPRRPQPVPIDWERFVGRRVLGWVAVGLLLLSASFFVKYAFDTVFGPTARVATAAAVGLGLCLVGGRLARRGYRLACSMVSSAGLLVLYLAVYASFGFYTLLTPTAGAAVLAAILAEGVLLSLAYRARPLAYLAVIGALLIPMLVPTDRDHYAALFLYLAVINVAAAALTNRVRHPGLSLLTLAGSQVLFWVWFDGHYHPEKAAAVVAFQGFLFLLWLVADRLERAVPPDWERVGGWVAGAAFAFVALHRIVGEEAPGWVGVLALGFALLYAVLGRLALRSAAVDVVRPATLLSLGLAFLGLAIPLQGGTLWSAVGWAAMGAALWWFGLRIDRPLLRGLGAAFLVTALIGLIWAQSEVSDPVLVPVFNPRSLPTLGVIAALLTAAWSARRFQPRLTDLDVAVRYSAGFLAVAMGWGLLTWEGFNTCRVIFDLSETTTQTAISVLWAAYAAVLLAVGFALPSPPTRWTGLGLLALTVLKLLTYDLSELPGVYRAVTFLAAAVVVAAAAWGYHRLTRLADKETARD